MTPRGTLERKEPTIQYFGRAGVRSALSGVFASMASSSCNPSFQFTPSLTLNLHTTTPYMPLPLVAVKVLTSGNLYRDRY